MKPLLSVLLAIGLLVGACSDDEAPPSNEKSLNQLSREFSDRVDDLGNDKLSAKDREGIRKDLEQRTDVIEKRVAQESRSLRSGKKHDQFVSDVQFMQKIIDENNTDSELDGIKGRIDGLPALAEAHALKQDAKEAGEKAKKAVGEAADDAGEAASDAAEKVKKGTKQAVDDAGEAASDAAEKVKEGTEEAADRASRAAEDVKEDLQEPANP